MTSLAPASRSAYDLTPSDLTQLCKDLNHPEYRSSQIWRWLYLQRVRDWNEMSNLPALLRAGLADRLPIATAEIIDTTSDQGHTAKFLIRLRDNELVEAVMIPDVTMGSRAICISCQVGCKFHCAFCASGQSGFRRNLSAGEMVEQIILAANNLGSQPTHVVFMGIGEPFDNYDAVLNAARTLNDHNGLNIGARRITISTCGVIPGILRLMREPQQFELSVSLHAPNNTLRTQLMPVNRSYPLPDLIATCAEYTRNTKRIVTFEYCLIQNVNDSESDADELAALLRSLPCRVNLIPLNVISEYEKKPSSPETARMFTRKLTEAGVHSTLRSTRGSAVNAACGQLRANNISGAGSVKNL